MKNSIFVARILCSALVVLVGGAAAWAQTSQVNAPATEGLVIYAKAGRINLAVGEARSRRSESDPGKPIATADEMADGDIVSTGPASQLEILLNPGSFLRLGENAELQMYSTDLEDIRFTLRRGSAMIETAGDKSFVPRIRIGTPSGVAFVASRGLYRVDIVPEGTSFVAVKGSLILGSKTVTLKDGERVLVTGSGAGLVARIAKSRAIDPLETWSRERAHVLAAANRRLDRRQVALAMRRAMAANASARSFRGQGGAWASNGSGGYTFLPFLSDWQSPYGYGYANQGTLSLTRITSGFYTGMVRGPGGVPMPPMRVLDPRQPPPRPLPPRPY